MWPLPWPGYCMVLPWLHPGHFSCTYVLMTHTPVAPMMVLPLVTSRNIQYVHLDPLQSGGCSLWHLWKQTRHRDMQSSMVTKLQTQSGWSEKQEPIACMGLLYSLTRWANVLLQWMFDLKGQNNCFFYNVNVLIYSAISSVLHKICVLKCFKALTVRNNICSTFVF